MINSRNYTKNTNIISLPHRKAKPNTNESNNDINCFIFIALIDLMRTFTNIHKNIKCNRLPLFSYFIKKSFNISCSIFCMMNFLFFFFETSSLYYFYS